MLTRHKDTDRKILSMLKDDDVLSFCQTEYSQVCNEEFFKQRVQNRYPGRENNEGSWKKLFIKLVKENQEVKKTIAQLYLEKLGELPILKTFEYISPSSELNFIMDKIATSPETFGMTPEVYFAATYNRYLVGKELASMISPKPDLTSGDIEAAKILIPIYIFPAQFKSFVFKKFFEFFYYGLLNFDANWDDFFNVL